MEGRQGILLNSESVSIIHKMTLIASIRDLLQELGISRDIDLRSGDEIEWYLGDNGEIIIRRVGGRDE